MSSAGVTTTGQPESGPHGATGHDGCGTRVFEHARIWRLDPGAFEEAARMLAAFEPPPVLIVGIARGGVELARFLGAWFGVPVATVTARHNVSDGAYAEMSDTVEVAGALPAAVSGGVLIVDDICGTGDTFTAVIAHVTTHLGPVAIRTVSLCCNDGSAFIPDAWAWSVSDWVAFPWEEPPPGRRTEPLAVPKRLCLKERQ